MYLYLVFCGSFSLESSEYPYSSSRTVLVLDQRDKMQTWFGNGEINSSKLTKTKRSLEKCCHFINEISCKMSKELHYKLLI